VDRFLLANTVQPNAPGSKGYNRYAYTANNPTAWTDPSGRAVGALPIVAGACVTPVTCLLVVGVLVGAVFWYIAMCLLGVLSIYQGMDFSVTTPPRPGTNPEPGGFPLPDPSWPDPPRLPRPAIPIPCLPFIACPDAPGMPDAPDLPDLWPEFPWPGSGADPVPDNPGVEPVPPGKPATSPAPSPVPQPSPVPPTQELRSLETRCVPELPFEKPGSPTIVTRIFVAESPRSGWGRG
jgi:hypothetical protein